MSESDNVPARNRKGPLYEAWFLTASDGRRGYWIRYSVKVPRKEPGEARLWVARFDREGEEPKAIFGLNRGFPPEAFASSGPEIAIGEARLGAGRARGELSGGGHHVSWDLAFDTGEPTFRLLPNALHATPGLAPTKPLVPNPSTRFSGIVTVDGTADTLEGVPGQQGHLYGTRHADRWAWAHCSAFLGTDAVFQGVSAQAQRGPATSPFTTFAGLRWQDRWIRFRRVSRKRDHALGVWRIELSNRRFRLTGRIQAPSDLMVEARYEDPDGTPRFCYHTDLGSARMTLFERTPHGFDEIDELVSDGTTHCEWAGRTQAPVEVRPHLAVQPE